MKLFLYFLLRVCYNFTPIFDPEPQPKRKAPLAESLFDVALKFFKLLCGANRQFTKTKVLTTLVKVILTIGEEDKADAVIFATVDISNEVVSNTEVLIGIDVNLHFVTFLLSLGVITL